MVWHLFLDQVVPGSSPGEATKLLFINKLYFSRDQNVTIKGLNTPFLYLKVLIILNAFSLFLDSSFAEIHLFPGHNYSTPNGDGPQLS